MEEDVQMREEIKHNIWWQIKSENTSFWFDNQTEIRALYYVQENNKGEQEIKVKEFINENRWNIEKLQQVLLEKMVKHNINNVCPNILEEIRGQIMVDGNP